MTAINPIKPSLALLIKLGSIIVHYQEFLSDNGHPLDIQAAKSLLQDEEVLEWFKAMNENVFLPVKRNK